MRRKGFPVILALLACLALGCFAGRKQVKNDEIPPEPAYWVTPDYSRFARLAGLNGTVVLKLLVAPDGSVLDVQLSKELHPNLDQAAVEAAKQWRFLPARRRYRPAERPVENTWIAVPFEFILRRVGKQWPPAGKVKLPWSEELLEPGATSR